MKGKSWLSLEVDAYCVFSQIETMEGSMGEVRCRRNAWALLPMA